MAFIGSAGLATWVSFARPEATRQLLGILAAFVVFYALVVAGRRVLRGAAWALLFGAGILAVAFTLTHDFGGDPGKLPVISRAGMALQKALLPGQEPPAWLGMELPPNSVGGVLAMTVPFGIALLWMGWKERSRAARVLAGALTLAALGGLLLTSSRGAMIGLAAAGSLAALVWVQRRWLAKPAMIAVYWSGIGLIAVGGLAVLALTGRMEALVGAVPDPQGSLQSRMEIWRQGLPLIGDYFFTGAGLASFRLVFSIYRLLIHVPYHEHMHNIFLEVWLEQGILGVLAMVWGALVVVGWWWNAISPREARGKTADASLYKLRPLGYAGLAALAPAPEGQTTDLNLYQLRPLGYAGLVALAAMGVHGMVDIIFYGKAAMPLVGLAVGSAWYANPGGASAEDMVRRRAWSLPAAIGVVAFALVLAVLYGKQALAGWYANMGAVIQTRIEMMAYDPDHFDSPLLDEIRRTEDLSQATRYLERALEVDTRQVTALQRLTQIELSRGEYPKALAIARTAWDTGYRDEVTSLLYSDALAANGEFEQAAEVARCCQWGAGRLSFQAWYRYWIAEDYLRAADAWRAVLQLEPGNAEAERWLEEVMKVTR